MGLKVKRIKLPHLENYLYMLQVQTMLSRTCEFGIRTVMYIAAQSLCGRRTDLEMIAKEIEAPKALTEKILQSLVRKKIIHAVSGEFEVNHKDLHQIKLSEIIEATKDEALQGTG